MLKSPRHEKPKPVHGGVGREKTGRNGEERERREGEDEEGYGVELAGAAVSSNTAAIKSKGKHASSTENRRMVWENVVWPLVLQVNRSYFTLKEYHAKRDEFCRTTGTVPSKVAGGFVSLLIKGIIGRDKNIYSIHYRLIPYMRKKAPLEYGLVIREVNTKR